MGILDRGTTRRAGINHILGLVAATFAIFIAVSAYGGPPFVTDDPDPVEYQKWEVNFGMTHLRAADTTTGFLPSIDANYGVAPGVQLHVQPQFAYVSGNGMHAWGVGDTEIGVKYRLTPESTNAQDWMIGIYPLLEIPTGSARRHLGAGSSSLYLPIWFQTT